MTHEFTPLKVSVAWLAGTYLMFLAVGEVEKVDNLFELTVYVSATIACLSLGYWWNAVRYRGARPIEPIQETPTRLSEVRTLVFLSGLYYLAYGLIYMTEYGVANPGAILAALSNPGSAYLAKFDVYDAQQASGERNLAGQIITLAAFLSAPLVPFLIVYWKRLTGDLRLLGLLGIVVYGTFFLAIGTLSGLGSVLIFAGVSLLVVRARAQHQGKRRRGLLVVGVVAGLIFAAYMSYNQGARISAVGTGYKYNPNPLVERLTNDQFARGLTVTTFYPTHGYQGLAYNLETHPFKWTHFRGSSRALDSYLDQYGFGRSVQDQTYPARTEDRTGWPAGRFWATIYPWLASDLTFPGAALFMFVVGWWMARWWREAVVAGSRLSLLLLCQMGVFIAFVPANNQLGIGRPSLITCTALIAVYGLLHLGKRLRSHDRGGPNAHVSIGHQRTVTSA